MTVPCKMAAARMVWSGGVRRTTGPLFFYLSKGAVHGSSRVSSKQEGQAGRSMAQAVRPYLLTSQAALGGSCGCALLPWLAGFASKILKKWVRRQDNMGCSDEGEREGQELTFECVLTTPIRSLAHKHCSFKYVQERHVHRRT